MQPSPLGNHAARYLARRVRFGMSVAAVAMALGAVRIATDWPPPQRWLLIPLSALAILHGLALVLPWRRLVRRRAVRRSLLACWFAALPLMFVFALFDEQTLPAYAVAAVLNTSLAAAVFSGRAVAILGAASFAGFLTLLSTERKPDGVVGAAIALMLLATVGTHVVIAGNRRRLEVSRRALQRRAEALLENASDAIIAIDDDGSISYVNVAMREVLRYDPLGEHNSDLRSEVHPDDMTRMRAWADELRSRPNGSTTRHEVRSQHADGTCRYFDVAGTNLLSDPDVRALIFSVRDITEHRALLDQVARQSFSDLLTGLPNRALFYDRLRHTLAGRRAERVALLLVDVSEFKLINDEWGSPTGDQLLITIADRLGEQVRPGDTVARLGGDEFAVLVSDLDVRDVATLAERIQRVLQQPARFQDHDVACAVNIGIAVTHAADATPTVDEMLRNADLAMYAAKQLGPGNYAVFDAQEHAGVLHKATWRRDLEQALVKDQFVLHYQPIVELDGHRLSGVEALIRWQHPAKGLLAPDSFIDVAESTGLIVPLGRWVLRQACSQLARWNDQDAGTRLRMSVNLSARQFEHPDLVDDVAAAIHDTGIDASRLTLEITETMLVRDPGTTAAVLRALRALGVHLAIDDFGTGYSALSYLKDFPVDILKVDRAFVAPITTDANAAALVRGILGLAEGLGLQTVAEGIETEQQLAVLDQLGCDFGQGYLFSRPVGSDAISAMLGSTDHARPAAA